jgi:hypothetical protein
MHVSLREIVDTVRNNSFSKLCIALYALQIIGLAYTANYSAGFFILEKKLTLLVIPLLLLPVLQKTDLDLKSLFRLIGIITILSSLVLLFIAGFKLLVLNNQDAFYFERVTSIHYVYYSIYFACGSLFLIDAAFDDYGKTKYGFIVVITLFLYALGMLVLIASKTGMMAFGLVSVILLYKRIGNKKMFALAILLFIFAGTAFLYFNETTRSRFYGLSDHLSVLQLNDFRGHEVPITDLNMRLLFWKISILHVWQDYAFMFGVGTGDAQDYINNLYALPQYNLMGYTNWDSHNQWVYTFIQLGLMGIAIMSVLYGKYIIQTLKKEDLKFLSFLLITLAFSFSESILESNKGIVFFALLFTLFCANDKKVSLHS